MEKELLILMMKTRECWWSVVAEVELAQLDGIETRNPVWGWHCTIGILAGQLYVTAQSAPI